VQVIGDTVRYEEGPELSLRAPRQGRLTMGVRAEDMQLAEPGQGHLSASIYTFELLGDSTMVNLRLADRVFSIKAPKDLRLARGDSVHVRLPQDKLYWFDADSGERLRG
jgi:multiple sugar transport system ATP-binding protein